MKRVCTPTSYAVRAAIAASLREGGATQPRVALLLGTSVRSLQRRIAQMGTSYRELVDEVRIDTACHLLAQSDERISGIAARLGFASPSSFSRTFVRLMKIRPMVYRQQQQPTQKSYAKCRRATGKTAARRFSPAPD